MWPKALLLVGSLLVAGPLQAQEPDYQLRLTVTDDAGLPAEGMQVVLFQFSDTRSSWRLVDSQVTGKHGEVDGFLPGNQHRGVYRLVLRNQKFFEQHNEKTLYPLIPIVISLDTGEEVSLSLSVSETAYALSRHKR